MNVIQSMRTSYSNRRLCITPVVKSILMRRMLLWKDIKKVEEN